VCACVESGTTLDAASSPATSDVQAHPLIAFACIVPKKPKLASKMLDMYCVIQNPWQLSKLTLGVLSVPTRNF